MQNAPPSETVESLLQAAQEQANKSNWSGAAVFVQRAIVLEPRNAPALHGAAQVALKLGNIGEAENFARRAAQQQPLVAYVLTLADIMKAKGDFNEAAKYYLLIQKQLPTELNSLLGLAEIYEQTGHRSLAIKYYDQALTAAPSDANLFRKFSKLLPFSDSPRVLAALERMRPADSVPIGAHLEFEASVATWTEYAERARQGVPPHARSPSDLFFNFARHKRDAYETLVDAALREQPKLAHAITAKATCLLSRGQRKEAERYFRLRASVDPNSLYANVVFNDEHYRLLEAKDDAELFGNFPDLIEVMTSRFEDAPIIFLSCDYNYFTKFARLMLLSINDVAQKPQVHLHIMDAPDEGLADAKAFCAKLTNTTVAISAERPGIRAKGIDAARFYYHAIRFIRMYQHLKRYNKPMWQMDVDGLMHRDPRPVFDSIGQDDVALWGHTGRWEPWNQFNASMMGIRPTPLGITYLRIIAAYIADFHSRDELHWGIDQLAMFSVHEFLKDQGRALAVKMLSTHVVDGECKDDGIVWSNGGIAKFSPLKLEGAMPGVVLDSPRVRYLELMNQYIGSL